MITFSDLEGHSPLASLLNGIFYTFVQHLTKGQLTTHCVIPHESQVKCSVEKHRLKINVSSFRERCKTGDSEGISKNGLLAICMAYYTHNICAVVCVSVPFSALTLLAVQIITKCVFWNEWRNNRGQLASLCSSEKIVVRHCVSMHACLCVHRS